jgi:hypothetical protein
MSRNLVTAKEDANMSKQEGSVSVGVPLQAGLSQGEENEQHVLPSKDVGLTEDSRSNNKEGSLEVVLLQEVEQDGRRDRWSVVKRGSPGTLVGAADLRVTHQQPRVSFGTYRGGRGSRGSVRYQYRRRAGRKSTILGPWRRRAPRGWTSRGRVRCWACSRGPVGQREKGDERR